MPLSTSSSRSITDLPDSLKMLVTGFLVFSITLILWETFLHQSNIHYSVENSYERWAAVRDKAAIHQNDSVVLIGASRIQMAIDIDVMEDYAPSRPLQLAVYSGSYLQVLEELSDDPNFMGMAIVSIVPSTLVSRFDKRISAEWVQRYRKASHKGIGAAYESIEAKIKLFIGENFLFAQDGARPIQLLVEDQINSHTYLDSERRIFADFELTDKEHLHQIKYNSYIGTNPQPVKRVLLPEILKRTVAAIDKITNRGGKVVLLRMPSSNEIFIGENIKYPRTDVWDQLSSQVTVPTIHFADYPSLQGFDLPDGVHIDSKDAAEFTRNLSNIIF